MAFKMKLFVTVAILLLGVTGVAFASSQVPGAVSGGSNTLTNSDGAGTGTGSGVQANDSVANGQNGNGEATETGVGGSAASDQYTDNDATETEVHGQDMDGQDEAGEMNDDHQGDMGRGAGHANEHANVPETTPVPGGNAPAHEMDNEGGQSAQGGATGSGTAGASGNSSAGSSATMTGTAGSHASSMKTHDR